MKLKSCLTLLCLLTIFCYSCTLFLQTVRVEVPKGYIGWVYVIPIKDTAGLNIKKEDGKFRVNKDGVVYLPAHVLNVKKDSRILVYEEGKDISADMRYAGSVHSVKENGKKYDYIHFFLPSFEERAIADHTQYWRDNSHKYRSEQYTLDSLLNTGKVVFK